jgi:hypothetical protein
VPQSLTNTNHSQVLNAAANNSTYNVKISLDQ